MTERHQSVKKTKGALTKEKIIKTARQLFYRKGYDTTTTAIIAKKVGVSEATLYKYFKNKMALLLATVKPQRLTFMEMAYYQSLTHQELLHVWIEELIDNVFYNRPQYSIIFNESTKHPELSEQYIANLYSMTNADRELVHRMDEGKLPKIDLILFQVGIIGSLLAMITHMQIYNPDLSLNAVPPNIRQTLIDLVEGKLFK
ncbi:TetR/AcrR family transcriptional regulator [Rummeliibacillus suwonensis]|uniref:TetR/AcrR family transcriptional regulator n=1 Tax=Rummeliibacillus suwonensis TaxID=1306154 RepID=UPI0011B741F3|nr:TetR/AcrR family transcriptional regulator [Rummeliibacillus suwonensis]MBO2537099.1 TetR/AcrR family transcriptional regulator [Rummeliibacillus suwonensis]